MLSLRPSTLRFLVPCLASMCLVIAALASAAGASTTTTPCSLFASPSGSDVGGDGSSGSPFASLVKLDSSLAPGQTGCLESGTYGSQSTEFDLYKNGTATGQITITAAPGATVQVDGFIDLYGSYTTLSGLTIDGSNTLDAQPPPLPSCPLVRSEAVQINGSHDVFENNDYYQSVAGLRGTAIGVGWNGPADYTIIRYNRIHDVGACGALDHMIYLAAGTGTQIYDNWMWNDPNGFGVQIYPGANGAHIFDNVIDAVGSGFAVGGTSATSNNTIDHNVVTNSTGLSRSGTTGVAILDWWPGTPGTGNTFDNNDCFNNPAGVSQAAAVTQSGNITTNPDMVNPAQHEYQINATSPVASWGLWDGSNSDTSTLATATTTTPTNTTPNTTPTTTTPTTTTPTATTPTTTTPTTTAPATNPPGTRKHRRGKPRTPSRVIKARSVKASAAAARARERRGHRRPAH
jgi:hypothetical protein